MQVVLNKKEKEELVAKLYQDGKPIREMASAVHMSFGDIGKIIKSLDGKDDINLSDKSKTTQAMFLFKSGKKPIDVAMELDISASEIEDILQEGSHPCVCLQIKSTSLHFIV
jgi:hypothetical protein